MIRDRSSGQAGYVLPQPAAEYFRDLFYYARAMEMQLDTLAHASAVGQEQAALREAQVRLLESRHRDLEAQIALYERDLKSLRETLQATDAARRRERRGHHLWRTTTFLLAGSTVALALVVVF